MSNILITTKEATSNLQAQAGNVKQSGLMLTSAVILTYLAYGQERADDARQAVRSAFIAAGFVKLDKGTKQPSDKARGFIKTAEAAVFNHNDKLRGIASGKSTEQQTQAIAEWCATFSLSNNHYEGGVYLMPLTLGISKKEARERIASRDAVNQQVADSDVTSVPAKGSKGKQSAPTTEKAEKVTIAATIGSLVPSLISTLHVTKGSKPALADSQAVVRAFNDVDCALRIMRGEKVQSASKEAKKLAVALAIHQQRVITAARTANKAVNAGAERKAKRKAA